MDILQSGEKSAFMRSDRGLFALRAWQPDFAEYKAERFKASLFDEDIVVFPAEALRSIAPKDGLTPLVPNSEQFYGLLRPMRRRGAEEDYSVVQLVSVFVVRHLGAVLTYKRTKRLPENRLHGFYSIAFGGHLNPDDVSPMFSILEADLGNPWLLRELREEVILDPGQLSSLVFRGVLYDSSRPVSRQHLGIVYEVNVSSRDFQIGERGFLVDAKYEATDEIRARIVDFENWSEMLLDSLENEWRQR